MKVGVFAVLLSQKPLEEALDYIKSKGIDTVEIGTGNYPGDAHCPLDELVKSEEARKNWLKLFKDRKMNISALSCHGNGLHPDKKIADKHTEVQRKTVQLCQQLGIKTMVTFSGCPGGGPNDKVPNWITCPWPEDFIEAVEWQWNEKVIPYWKKEGEFAAEHKVRIAFEMHPGFVVYNPETMLKCRKACGKNIGANFDPSHLFWQGIDPCAALRELKDCLFHVHAKDTAVHEWNVTRNGVLDTKHYGDELNRAWIFRTCGYGNGEDFWRNFISTLKLCGFDGALSIEHEDSLMSVDEGLTKAIDFLQDLIIKEKAGGMWWA